jgi:hypothetical protein
LEENFIQKRGSIIPIKQMPHGDKSKELKSPILALLERKRQELFIFLKSVSK